MYQWQYQNNIQTVNYPIAFSSAAYEAVMVIQANNRDSGYDKRPFYVTELNRTNMTYTFAGTRRVIIIGR